MSKLVKITLPKQCINECTHAGDCSEDVNRWLLSPKVSRQLKKVALLGWQNWIAESGAWSREELTGSEESRTYVIALWMVAGEIKEEGGVFTYVEVDDGD